MVTVHHAPFGIEHPYEQQPEERFPRQPLAGEAFEIGIVTRPHAAVSKVTVHSAIQGVEQALLSAHPLGEWRPELEHGVGAEFLDRIVKIEQDVWRAKLIAPSFGETLRYTIAATTPQSEVLHTETFTLTGAQWQLTEISQHVHSIGEGMLPLISAHVLIDGNTSKRIRLTFASPREERFYGLGERFNQLNQRGQTLDVRVYEQYKNHGKKTYMPIPFLLSSQGYGVWVQSSRWMQFDLADSSPDQWKLEADIDDDGKVTLQWYANTNPVDIVAAFARDTGPVALPPQWSFGLWMSGNEWNSQAKIVQEVERSLAEGIQPAVLVIEAWSDETTFYIWNDAQYTPKEGAENFRLEDFTFPSDGKWTDPKGMVDWLHSKGIKVLLWQVPVLKALENEHPQHSADHAHFVERGLGVHEADGTMHKVRPFWFRGSYIWDVTNSESRDWWLNKRAYLLDDLGIDGFKTDGGEHLYGTNVMFHDGRTGADVWNEYPQRYTQAYYDFANSKREAVTFSRSGYTGSQRAPLHWAGDENSTWEAFRHSVLAGLSAAASGISFWGWDFGGFSGDIPSAELYLRAMAMATFCPVLQYHSEYNAHRSPSHDRTPWNIQERTGDERVLPIFKAMMAAREQLKPYLWQEAQHSAQTGEPMMRALQWSHPKASPYHYLLGRDLLIAPIVEAGSTKIEVYLPSGMWRDFWTDERVEGGRIIAVDVPLERIAVWWRD